MALAEQERKKTGSITNKFELTPEKTNGEFQRPLDSVLITDASTKEWSITPATVLEYDGGVICNPDGSIDYKYDSGKRLLIKDYEVMDTCQKQFVQELVNAAFKRLTKKEGDPVRVFEAGWGLGISAERVMRNLAARYFAFNSGGEYRGVELNRDVYETAKTWKTKWDQQIGALNENTEEPKSKLKSVLYHGEAGEVAEDFIKRGKKFDIIISDTFPIKPEQKAINDLIHMPIFIQLLDEKGVFAFVAYSKDANGYTKDKIRELQLSKFAKYFNGYRQYDVPVNPPPDYEFLKERDGSIVRSLSFILCWGPRK